MEKKVYVVTSGWSSDYKVEGVFSTKENAEKYVLVFGEKNDLFSIDEWEVDEYFNNRIREYVVDIDYDTGNVTRIQEREWVSFPNPSNSIKAYIIGGAPIIEMSFATDKIESIKKIATERLMQIKALEQIKFPYLFRKVVLGSCYALPNISEDRRNKHYPIYDFNSGHILLQGWQDLKTGIKAVTERIDK
mgnify:CR=1 FL=1